MGDVLIGKRILVNVESMELTGMQLGLGDQLLVTDSIKSTPSS